MQRDILKPLVGKRRQHFQGTFIRTGFKHDGDETATILLRDVTLDGVQVTKHLWLPYTKELTKLGMLWPGDVLAFTAMVVEYDHAGKKYAVGDNVISSDFYTEYGVNRPMKFKIVKKANMPADVERQDLTDLRMHSDFQERLNAFARYLSFVISEHANELNIPPADFDESDNENSQQFVV